MMKPLVAVMVAVGLSGCSAMLGSDGFYDEDRTAEAPDTAVMNRIMEGLGGVDTTREPISYKPRSPLAMPPTSGDLPPPESTDAVETNQAAWPQDPETVNAKERQEATVREMQRMEREEHSRLTKDELERGRIPGAGQPRALSYAERLDEIAGKPQRLTRAEIAGQRTNVPEATTYAPGEVPERRYLIEPPTKYRTPSPDAPVALPEEKDSEVGSWFSGIFN